MFAALEVDRCHRLLLVLLVTQPELWCYVSWSDYIILPWASARSYISESSQPVIPSFSARSDDLWLNRIFLCSPCPRTEAYRRLDEGRSVSNRYTRHQPNYHIVGSLNKCNPTVQNPSAMTYLFHICRNSQPISISNRLRQRPVVGILPAYPMFLVADYSIRVQHFKFVDTRDAKYLNSSLNALDNPSTILESAWRSWAFFSSFI